jgi:hypothetical protein
MMRTGQGTRRASGASLERVDAAGEFKESSKYRRLYGFLSSDIGRNLPR